MTGRRKRPIKKHGKSVSKQQLAHLSLVRRLGGERQAQEFEKRADARKKALDSDPIFYSETERLRKEIKAAYSYNPEAIDSFFHRFSLPLFSNWQEARTFIRTLPPAIQDVLEKYIRYTSRFGVHFVHQGQEFKMRYLSIYGWKFHVQLKDGRLEPLQSVPPDDEAAAYFESEELKVPQQIQELIGSEQAKYVCIDDSSGYSILNELESFAYHPEGITLILHNAERPYLLCIYGENASKELLHRAGKAVSAFQREHYGRGKGGRPADVKRRKKISELLEEPGSLKEKAGQVDTTGYISSSQSFVSRVRKETK
jgi:hypothetical protein